MKAVFAPLRESEAYRRAVKELTAKAGSVLADGCADSQKIHLAFAFAGEEEIAPKARIRLFVTYSDLRAREIYEDCCFYDRNTVLFPAKDLIFYQADLRSREIETRRIRTLRRLLSGRPVTIVTTFAALMTPQVPLAVLRDSVLSIAKGETLSLETIARRLVDMGYERNYQVDSPGQFSIRGDIVDIFDLTEENPFRIEFWGDEIDAIRSFDVLSQRSIEELSSVHVFPAREVLIPDRRFRDGTDRIRKELSVRLDKLSEGGRVEEASLLKKTVEEALSSAENTQDYSSLEGFLRYFYPAAGTFLDLAPEEGTLVFLDEPRHIGEQSDAVELEFRQSMTQRAEKGYILPGQMDLLTPGSKVFASLHRYRRAGLCTLGASSDLFPGEALHLRARTVSPYNSSFDTLVSDLAKYKKNGSRVIILSASRTRAKRLAADLADREIAAFYTDNPDREVKKGETEVIYGHAAHGFEYPDLGFTVLAETDIFGGGKKKKEKKHRYSDTGERIRSLNDLKVGDYVVHEDNGIGIYRGIEKIEVDHIAKDYIKIEYGGKDVLYVLPTDLDVLQKYSDGGDDRPKLNRLGTQEWTNTRKKVEKAVELVADDLVKLYADRQSRQGHVFEKDTAWQREFEELFPYEETEDQLTAIADVKKDMESPKIMDRLICGDVGYGKTEIAIRAAFKAVQGGMQVAVLVPTTILAQQHYNTFTARMRNYPVNIGELSRFASAAEQRKTIKGLADGTIDIVIGTHRLLSKDVKFKKLGLLVIDEEQRFGVSHKEQIKEMKRDVDVITLTATPIPRTLHMSLVGIRDMSILEEAPGERQPIQTYVMEYNEEMIREAVSRELARGGQVYYVHNRVNDIDRVTANLRELVPEARIAFAHGQMDKRDLETIMYRFISREIDVLVSTTIIETGLDISNVNTMIVDEADKMGLAQLYQLRGRVGRSSRTAYAFLMYRRNGMLKEDAEKRLAAIREFTDLGSGYRIAMRDLEIRGAGSVLGRAQHGHMAQVGYDLYCKMLNEAVRKAKGDPAPEEKNCTVKFEADAFIPESYIVNETQKLDIYKKISEITSLEECEDMKDELRDRFGDIPAPLSNLLRIALIRAVGRSLDLAEITGTFGLIRIVPDAHAALRVERLPEFLKRFRPDLKFIAKGTPSFEYTFKTSGVTEKDEETMLTDTEELLAAISEILR